MHLPTIDQLKKALHIRENIDKLQNELGSLFGRAGAKVLGVVEVGLRSATKGIQAIKVTPQVSKAARSKGKKGRTARAARPAKTRKRGRMSAAGRANIVKAQKARWAKVKAAKAKAGK